MKHRIVSLVLARLAIALVTAIIVSFAVFFATAMLPGDTATILLGQAATPEAVEGLRKAMHLDDPAIFRFLRWLAGVVHGDLGVSYANNMPVATGMVLVDRNRIAVEVKQMLPRSPDRR